MRLKIWLLLSYLIVMILPLVAAYLLFAWISAYNDEEKVEEFFDVSNELSVIRIILDDPVLYKPGSDKTELDKMTNDRMSVVLYNPDGLVVYTSNPVLKPTHSITSKEVLYDRLYRLEQGYRSYSYKQPVFDGQNLVGIFEVELAREAWVAGVSDRSLLIFIIFIGFFITIYLLVVYFINKKINRRLMGLMDEMTAFANGKTLPEMKTNNDEIGKLTRRFYEMRNQINAANQIIETEQKEKEYMIATISHDLKTPLTSIKAYAESLDEERGLTAQERKEYRSVIIEKSDFMKQMLDDLLTYTIMQSPTYEMEVVQVEGDEFFEMLVADYEALCKKKHIQLSNYADVTGIYELNPKQMIRVTDNLMSNAIKHTEVNGKVWLAAISEQDSAPSWLYGFVDMTFHFNQYVYLIVQNEGQGIAEKNMHQVFHPLFQEDHARSKRDEHGTGLGLSITKQIIDKHNGETRIFSKKEIGTCVIIQLPKKKEDEVNEFFEEE